MRQVASKTELGPYRLLQSIGEGGFARVYLALKDCEPCILKVLKPERIQINPSAVDHFVREVKIGTSLKHANLLHFVDQGEVGGFYFGVMPYRIALPLHRLLEAYRVAGKWIPLELSLFVIREIAKGLSFLHQSSVFKHSTSMLFHGDLSSDNILLSKDGGVFLGDFGSSREETTSDKAALHYGKITYLPAEVLEGRPVSRQTDIYSLAVLSFYLLFGSKPFLASNRKEMIQLQSKKRPKIGNGLTSNSKDETGLQIFFNKALNQNPELRFENVRSFAEAFFAIRFKARPALNGVLASAAFEKRFQEGLVHLQEDWERKIREALDLGKRHVNVSTPGQQRNLLVHQEVRKFPRVITTGRGLKAEVISPSDKYKSEFEIHEIGRGGCLMRWQALEPKRGQTYPIFMRLSEKGPPIKIMGKLCYDVKRKGRTYVGFQFTTISDTAAEQIAAYVQKNLKTSDLRVNKEELEETVIEVFFETEMDWKKEFRENIAFGGLFVKAGQAFERDQKVKVKIRLPNSDRQLILEGKVASCSPLPDAPNSHGVGVELNLSKEKLKALQALAGT